MAREMIRTACAALAIAAVIASRAGAQPSQAPRAPATPSAILSEGNAAAIAGDWPRVAALVAPLARASGHATTTAELAEAHRLAGLAAFFLEQPPQPGAEAEFLAYLAIDPDAHLDPSLYPPEVVTFFEDVRARHAAELRARHPHGKRHVIISLVPIAAQIQNGDRGKAWVAGGLLAGFGAANLTSYLLLRHWCEDQGSTCDRTGTDHTSAAKDLRVVNIAGGIAFLATAAWAFYDGVTTYRAIDRREQQLQFQPMAVALPSGGAVFGVGARF